MGSLTTDTHSIKALSNAPSFLCRLCVSPLTTVDNLTFACEQCGHVESHEPLKKKSLELTISMTLTALIFFIPANLLPFMTIELYGTSNSATIWEGIRTLADSGSLFIAMVIFIASILVPAVKLIVLLYICLTKNHLKNQKLKTKLYLFIESIGRWSMLDIFLLAVMVAVMKLGPWTRVEPGPGALFFLLVVIFTMLASSNFDTRLIWQSKNKNLESEDKNAEKFVQA